MKKILLLLLLISLSTSTCFSQDNTMENYVQDIKDKGKQAIIAMALELLHQENPEIPIKPEDYMITVWANDAEVLVKFQRLIRYETKGSNYTYDISVNVVNKAIEPFNSTFFSESFFVPDERQKAAIEFVKRHTGIPNSGFEHCIYEEDEEYFITLFNESTLVTYALNKVTGKKSAELIATQIPMPAPDNPDWEELAQVSPLEEILE